MKNISPMHRGFTLVELLVVISIIALLIAILLPALQKARKAGQLVVASSQVRQLTIALRMYANDSKYRLPFANDNPADMWDRGAGGLYWGDHLLKGQYVSGGKDVFFSPGHARKLTTEGELKFSGFGVNHLGPMPTNQQYTSGKWGPPIHLDEGHGPADSSVLLMADSSWVALFNAGTADGAFILAQQMFTYDGKLARGYLDGHATTRTGDDLFWTAYDQRNGVLNLPNDRYWGVPWWNQKFWWPPYGNGASPWPRSF